MRAVCEVLGVKNVLGKIIGSTNPINVVRATLNALKTTSNFRSLLLLNAENRFEEILGS